MAKQRQVLQLRKFRGVPLWWFGIAGFKAYNARRAWHGYKYIDPKESGAVIPILHVNGFKISERTIFGCMDDKEIVALFT